MRPFLKWAGGKYKALEQLQKVLPQGKRLLEPFVGSGAVFLNSHYPAYVLADVNIDLIHLYQFLQQEGDNFIDYCRHLFTPRNNAAASYYRLRDRFNQAQDLRLRSALFVYLNRHGFNGLCRYNASGQYNVPFGHYRKPCLQVEQMQHFHQVAQKAQFCQQDFVTSMRLARKGDVVYCDPPYVPLSATANFTQYSQKEFGLEQQMQLAEEAERLAQRGITVVISNHDTKLTRKLYRNAKITSFNVARSISRDVTTRGNVKELLAVFGV